MSQDIFNWPRKLFHKALQALDYKTFVSLINYHLFLRGSSIRVLWEKGNYKAIDGENEIFLASKMRYGRYFRGIIPSLDSLASRYYLDLIQFNNGDVFIDCGANIGELGKWIQLQNTEIKYIAFEPSPKEFAVLQKNVPKGTFFNLGLWKNTSKLNFHIATDTADSSVFNISNATETIEIKCVRLDELLDCAEIKLFKVEAEGGEPEVLLGAEKLLAKCEYIVVDSGPERGLNQEETTPTVINYLISNGFQLIAISHKRVICLFKRKQNE